MELRRTIESYILKYVQFSSVSSYNYAMNIISGIRSMCSNVHETSRTKKQIEMITVEPCPCSSFWKVRRTENSCENFIHSCPQQITQLMVSQYSDQNEQVSFCGLLCGSHTNL